MYGRDRDGSVLRIQGNLDNKQEKERMVRNPIIVSKQDRKYWRKFIEDITTREELMVVNRLNEDTSGVRE